MAAKRRNFDVWLTAASRVYKGVPWNVLADWAQEGRLLGEDKIKEQGEVEWRPVREVPGLTVFLPRADEHRADDQAEALEPVQLDLVIRHRPGEDDEDVDMIPLIDISLVLLIFFMMTSVVAVSGAGIPTPDVANGAQLSESGLWVGIDCGPGGAPVYSFGEGSKPPAEGNIGLTETQVLEKVDARLREQAGRYVVRVAANKQLPYETVQRLTQLLEQRKPKGVDSVVAEVSEKKS
jgi:biopolymer transport protein ExbD